MSYSKLGQLLAMGEAVAAAARMLDRVARQKLKPASIPRGATLRPGVETPLWRALVVAIHPLLQRRGAKALLAHELGLHRGRISDYFVTQTAMPDAERTLLLLEWYRQQRLHSDRTGRKR